MKYAFIILVLTLFLITACLQQPATPTEPTAPVEEPEQTCTERWICQDENTKAYRKSDCTFEKITNCPAGCENAECKEEIVEEKETELEEPKEETKETCTIGYKCLDENRRGYQTSDCMFRNVDECKYGCKDGACITEAPPEEEEEETFTLTEGKGTWDFPGWKYFDFSKEQTFLDEVYDYDFKIKLYASASAYDYFRAESSGNSLWIIEKGITEAERADCIEGISNMNYFVYLRTGQTLCINTREKNTALVGGYWEGLPSEDTELTWKYYTTK